MIFSLIEYKQRLLPSFLFTTLFFFWAAFSTVCQKNLIQRVDPPNWWVGMETDTVELLITKNTPFDIEYKVISDNATVVHQESARNPKYNYVTIVVSAQAEPGPIEFELSGKGIKKKSRYAYPLLKRSGNMPRKVTAADNMYLVFPDRFANGDDKNDSADGMYEKADRTALKGRHGGDLKGIEDHLDFIEDMGMTALWINPVLENNQHRESYHGYAATDSYRIDPRFGTNEQFRSLVEKCHSRNIKVVWDVVYNHWGDEHQLFKELPDSNWIHWFPEFTRTSYRAEVLMDPYASQEDRKIFSDGWFDRHMPDLNQQDPHLARYLIQNSIWWVEFAGLDAFRIDTYAYPDQHFMSRLNQSVKREFPDLFIFGETWVQSSPVQAWFTKGRRLGQPFDSHLDGVTDFQWYYAVTKALNENFGWEEGLRRIELTIAHDYLYEDIQQNVTFLDNHDLGRFYSMTGEDFGKWKIGMSLLGSMRGIPCVYYGNEILMTGFTDPDAHVRKDFPGGWKDDPVNLFRPEEMNSQQKEAYDFTCRLFQWRKKNPWMGEASTVQFVPENNIYVYFRKKDERTLMCIYNMNDDARDVHLSRFRETMGTSVSGTDIISNARVQLENSIRIDGKSAWLIELIP